MDDSKDKSTGFNIADFMAQRESEELAECQRNPLAYLQKPFPFTKIAKELVDTNEECALWYIEHGHNVEIRKACVKWLSCADLIFPKLRKYLDDSVKFEIYRLHDSYIDHLITDVSESSHNLDELMPLLGVLAEKEEFVSFVRNAVEMLPDFPHKAQYAQILGTCALTSESIASELIDVYPMYLVRLSATKWKGLVGKICARDPSLIEVCLRQHPDMQSELNAAKYAKSYKPTSTKHTTYKMK